MKHCIKKSYYCDRKFLQLGRHLKLKKKKNKIIKKKKNRKKKKLITAFASIILLLIFHGINQIVFRNALKKAKNGYKLKRVRISPYSEY